MAIVTKLFGNSGWHNIVIRTVACQVKREKSMQERSGRVVNCPVKIYAKGSVVCISSYRVSDLWSLIKRLETTAKFFL